MNYYTLSTDHGVEYFSTEKKFAYWRKDHPEITEPRLEVHEIGIECVRELGKIARKRLTGRITAKMIHAAVRQMKLKELKPGADGVLRLEIPVG